MHTYASVHTFSAAISLLHQAPFAETWDEHRGIPAEIPLCALHLEASSMPERTHIAYTHVPAS